MTKRNDDSTVARIAGNIASGLMYADDRDDPKIVAKKAVAFARAIIAEVERTEPKHPEHVCGLQGFGALGDTCPACEAERTERELEPEQGRV